MESSEPWRRKMVVQNVPEDWSQDMLENYMEVVTRVELDEGVGVERFFNVSHTVLLTFLDPLTEEHLKNTQMRNEQKNKPLLFSLIPTAPTALLARDVSYGVTEDNLFFYFESSRSGGMEGTVENCHIYPANSMAVIVFNSPEAAEAVLAVRDHSPSKGAHISVKPCYEQFHKKILDDLNQPQTPSVSSSPHTHGGGQGGGPAAAGRQGPPVAEKPSQNQPKHFLAQGKEQDHFRTRRGSGNDLPSPQQDLPADMLGDGDTGRYYPPQYQRGGRKKRRNKRGNNQGQHGPGEDSNQSDRSRGSRGNQRSRGGRPFGYNSKRGRGYWGERRGYASHPQEAELFDCEPRHVTSPTQSAAPQPIKLDADCNPVPQAWGPHSQHPARAAAPQSEEYHTAEDRSGDSNGVDVSVEDNDLDDSSQRPRGYRQDTHEPAATKPSLHAPKTAPVFHRAEAASKNPSVLKTGVYPERWAEARGSAAQAEIVSQSQREKEREAEQLKQEKLKLERELQKRDQLREEDRMRMEQMEKELETVKQEKEKLEDRKKKTLSFPAYKLRLMKNFAETCTMCDIIIHEKEGCVDICGTGENVDAAIYGFLYTLQDSVEDSLDITPALVAIFRTEAGQQYLNQMNEDHTSCSFDIQDSRIVCVAFSMRDVQNLLTDLQRNMCKGKMKISKSLLPQLQVLKQQLERDVQLATLILPQDDSCEVTVEGLNGDYDMVLRQLQDYCSRNQPGHGSFQIVDPLEMKACNLWCTQALDDVKALILKNNGDCKALDHPSQIGFTFHCNKDLLDQVLQKLGNIRKVINISRINLQVELTRYSERALVINGINGQGMEPFCRQLEGRLKKEGDWDTVVQFRLPAKCSLPKFEYVQAKRPSARPSRPKPPMPSRPPRQVIPRLRRYGSRSSIHPYTTKVGSSSFTIKSGDIASESVDGMVCVVAEDMDLKQTAVGQSILKKYPQCAQLFPQGTPGAAGAVVSKAMQASPLQASPLNRLQARLVSASQSQPSTLHLAVLTKWTQQTLMAQIKNVVQRCLQSAAQQGNMSIAFPPLGMGRKFQFPLDTVVNAMVTTVYQFLQSNRGTLQSVVFVIYDVGSARQFREAAKKIINPPMPAFMGSTQQSDQSDSDGDYAADDSDEGDFLTASANSQFDFFQAAQDDDIRGGGGGGGDFWGEGGQGGNGSDNDEEEELDFLTFNDEDDQTNLKVFAAAPQPRTRTPSSSFEAQVCVRNQQDFNAIKQGLLRELRSTFVYEDRLTDIRTFKKLGARTMDDIKTAALRIGVVLTVQNTGGRETLVVRGQREGVLDMMMQIKDKQHAYHQKQESREHKTPGGLPSASKRLRLPTYWKVCQDNLFKDLAQFLRDHRTYGKLYTMGSEETKEINTLIQKTWVQNLVGAGKDARNLNHKGVKIVKVERLENPNLWEEYCTVRERFFRRYQQQAFSDIAKAKGSSGPIMTTSNLSRQSLLDRDIFHQINEHYLFHGTKKEYIQPIHDQGLDTRIANEGAMLGRGVYASESATKADQYTDDRTNRSSGNKTMILMRVLLGEAFINKSGNPTKYSRPPCKRCYQDRCSKCQGAGFFDSVIDDAGRNFREFVIYDRCMCYPEYFITYQRI